MGKQHGLLNVWTILAAIVLGISTVLFSLSHISTAIIATGLGFLLLTIALHFELDKKFGKRSRFIAPIIALISLISLYLVYPSKYVQKTNTDISKQQIQPKDSTAQKKKTDSLLSLKPKLKKTSPQYHSPQQTVPDLPIETLTHTTRPISSNNPEFPFALEIIIQSNVTIDTPKFLIECDGVINDARAEFINSSMIIGSKYYFVNNNTSLEFHCQLPPISPKNPLMVIVYSKIKVNVLRVTHI